jgi:prophage DNA circulation protein
MMIWLDAEEVMGIVRRVAVVVLSTVPSKRGPTAAALRRAVGIMVADENMTHIGTFAIAFRVCLDLARLSGATLQTMGRVRAAALAETPQSLPAVLTVQAMIRLGLAQEARLVTSINFTSRDDAVAVADSMTAAFTEAAEVASDDLDAASYMAIIGLQASVTKYLADSGLLLPRVVPYSFPITMPSLTMAQRTYTDAERADELRLENKVVHPAFMPRDGRMLAV